MKTVQLLGGGRTHGVPPVFVPGAERWGLNDLAFRRFSGQFDEWTRWWDLHPTEHILAKRQQAYEWYRGQSKPVYRLERDPLIPSSLAYPFAEIAEFFRTRRFGLQLDYMLALAIFEGFERIELVWFHMREREYAGAQTLFWLGQAQARGVEVVIHGDSALQAPERLYGYEVYGRS